MAKLIVKGACGYSEKDSVYETIFCCAKTFVFRSYGGRVVTVDDIEVLKKKAFSKDYAQCATTSVL